MSESTLDINATFRGGGRSVEWLDQINQASIVMLPPRGLPSGRAETGIVTKSVAQRTGAKNGCAGNKDFSPPY